MTLIEALRLVLSLAEDNQLDPESVQGDEILEDEAARQDKAVALVWGLYGVLAVDKSGQLLALEEQVKRWVVDSRLMMD